MSISKKNSESEKNARTKIISATAALLVVNAMLAASPAAYANENVPSAQQPQAATHERIGKEEERDRTERTDRKEKKEKKEKTKNKAAYEKKSPTRDILKSVLNLSDSELDAKLAENDNNIYKILEKAGKIEEYKTAVLANCKEILDKMVAENKMTREEADNMYVKAKEAMENFSETNFGWGTQDKRGKQGQRNKQDKEDKQDKREQKKNDNVVSTEKPSAADAGERKEGNKESIGDKINKWRNKDKDAQNRTNTTER